LLVKIGSSASGYSNSCLSSSSWFSINTISGLIIASFFPSSELLSSVTGSVGSSIGSLFESVLAKLFSNKF
jgi:hypothetical protein